MQQFYPGTGPSKRLKPVIWQVMTVQSFNEKYDWISERDRRFVSMSISVLYRMREGWNIELTSCDVGIVSITGAVVTIVFVSPLPSLPLTPWRQGDVQVTSAHRLIYGAQ